MIYSMNFMISDKSKGTKYMNHGGQVGVQAVGKRLR